MKQQRRRAGLSARVVICLLATVALVASGCANRGGANAGQDARFPKTVTLVVPFAPGGGTDIWARLLATALQPQLPGRPNVQVENLPGGEGIPGNNRFAMQDAPDGSRLLVGTGSSYTPALLGMKGVEYDFQKLVPLLSNGTGSVLYATKASGIKSMKDLIAPGAVLRYGGVSATGSDIGALISFDLLKLNVETTFGFEGRGPIGLAVQRGELTIDRQTTSAYYSTVQPMVEKGEATPLMTYGVLDPVTGKVVRDPNFPDLPTLPEVYQDLYGTPPSGPAYDAYIIFGIGIYAFEKTLWAKPGTPESITKPFIDSVDALTKDTEFEKQRTDSLGNYPLVKGSEIGGIVKEVFNITPEVRTYVTDLLKNKYNTTVE
jgi:tripartite-type tricarboxylate transporter receptor subunit TctC